MNAEEREIRIRHGIDQRLYEMTPLGDQFVILATERNDLHRRLQARELGHPVTVQAGTVDEKTRTLTMIAVSIINGSQTQGEVQKYIDSGGDGDAAHIKFELIVIDDNDLVADISIARNFQNDVQLLSIAGRKGELDELERSLQKLDSELRLQKSESQRPNGENDVIQTEKLLQVIAALLPPSLWWKQGDCNKTYTYSAKATCLKDFRKIHDGSQDNASPFKAVYEYYLDIAPVAWKTYLRWKSHQGFQGTGLRSIERDGREIVDVPDGIIFPILASLSTFVVKTSDGWVLKQPPQLADEKLIGVAKQAYQEIAKHKPEIMGKTKACYSQLETITSIYKELLN